MFTTFLLTLFFGISLGLLLTTLLILYLFKIKCPQCKQLKPVKEIVLFDWKQRIFSGQPCLKCQTIKPQVHIF
jgi:hypothetical protein